MPRLTRHPLVFWVMVPVGILLFSARARCRVHRVQVQGASMLPTLAPGDRLLVVRRRHPPRPGALVAVADPRLRFAAPAGPGSFHRRRLRDGARPTTSPGPDGQGRLLVKRLASVTSTGSLVVHGDAADASTDSRHFGPVPARLLVGEAVYRYAPVGRSGWLGGRSRRQRGPAGSVP